MISLLAGGKPFTKMDLSHTYQLVKLDLQSQLYTTINTHKGLGRGLKIINSTPSIFQCLMENLLQGLPQVSVYIDDILITGHIESEHVANVEKVLERLSLAGMKLRQEKSIFMAPEVQYLGHKITKQGIEPTEEKVEAIVQSPHPTNISELKAFIGLINYYGKFIPNLSMVLNPLYSLLHKTENGTGSQNKKKHSKKLRN